MTGRNMRCSHAALLLSVLATSGACHRGPTPCVSASVCGDGLECLANRCVPSGGEPVSPKAIRAVLEPTRLAVVSAQIEPGALPTVVTFGSHARGATRLLLEFRDSLQLREVEAAFLLLDPASGVARGNEDVTVEAFRLADAWDDAALSWVRAPRRLLPSATGIARPSPPTPLRIDVTNIVRYLAAHPEAHRGLLLSAGAGAGAGVSFSTGIAGGQGPRLELYGR